MVKEIRKIGNSRGIILDAAILEHMHVDVGDKVNVEIHSGGTLTITPESPRISAEEAGDAAREIIKNNDELFRRLS
ncbi:MAG: hypothetical protein AAGA58_17175 [Verrucomicrobiota bacterium]